MVEKVKKKIVYIKPLQNVVEINVLSTETVGKFKQNPHALIALGVSDFYNLLHRISQKVAIDKINESQIKNFTTAILHSVLGQIFKASVEDENPEAFNEEEFNCSVTEFDINFLKEVKIDHKSLQGDDVKLP